MLVCGMDARVGGRFRLRWSGGGTGREFGFHGEFARFDAPDRFVRRGNYDSGTGVVDVVDSGVVTTEFTEGDGRTLMKASIRYPDTAARDAVPGTGMTGSMKMGYGGLDGLLSGPTASDPNASRDVRVTGFGGPVGGRGNPDFDVVAGGRRHPLPAGCRHGEYGATATRYGETGRGRAARRCLAAAMTGTRISTGDGI